MSDLEERLRQVRGRGAHHTDHGSIHMDPAQLLPAGRRPGGCLDGRYHRRREPLGYGPL